jgi:hypothetical protein
VNMEPCCAEQSMLHKPAVSVYVHQFSLYVRELGNDWTTDVDFHLNQSFVGLLQLVPYFIDQITCILFPNRDVCELSVSA